MSKYLPKWATKYVPSSKVCLTVLTVAEVIFCLFKALHGTNLHVFHLDVEPLEEFGVSTLVQYATAFGLIKSKYFDKHPALIAGDAISNIVLAILLLT
jgi:hypothetical protein